MRKAILASLVGVVSAFCIYCVWCQSEWLEICDELVEHSSDDLWPSTHSKSSTYYHLGSLYIGCSEKQWKEKIALLETVFEQSRSYSTAKSAVTLCGITPEKTRLHRDVMVKTAATYLNSTETDVLTATPVSFEYKNVAEKAAIYLQSDPLGNTTATVRIKLRVRNGTGWHTYIAHNAQSAPKEWILPLEVEEGGRRWTTFSPDIARGVEPFVALDSPHRALFDGEKAIEEGFWKSTNIWFDPGYNAVSDQRANRIPNRDKIRDKLTISSGVSQGIFDIRFKTPNHVIDEFCWDTGAQAWKNGDADWSDLLKKCLEIDQLASNLQWLKDWKRSPARNGEPKNIRVCLEGAKASSTGDWIGSLYRPRWNKAQLPGQMKALLMLRSPNALIVISGDTKKTLVCEASGARECGTHWLDRLSLHDTNDYAVVEPNGQCRIAQSKSP